MTRKLFPYQNLQYSGPDQGPPDPHEKGFWFGFGLDCRRSISPYGTPCLERGGKCLPKWESVKNEIFVLPS